ncbi:flavin reductase family protein [Lactobacillus sp. LC28-10]|uniref:Flavin reductase family protein n=1 Tax=Secundilactobacillus angelensis TaxID=2722706 RepID=A0ABX1KWQ0_9LACO|nr:flavin reductase family protein [Secundilactobacillus angelensis]MCH5462145.1 flavin reductase family protein [Secundilactobacillus angelensis]NLR18374.1 flavin reductase family protein [Secundilactobacillus angelensis]
MQHFSSNSLTALKRYKLLSGSIIPRPIAWVTTLGPKPKQRLNIAPFSFFSAISSELPLMTLAIGRKQNQLKDTAANLLDNQEAVVHLVSQSLATEMNQTAASLPRDQSELDLTQLATTPSQTISVPALVAPKVRFETTLYQYVPITDNQAQVQSDLFILEVNDFYFADEVLDTQTFHVDAAKLDPLARLAGSVYGTVDGLFEMKRPL